MTLASVDWWARGFGIAGAVAGAASLIWNVYMWRKTHRVSIRARSRYDTAALGVPLLTIQLRNRGATNLIIQDVKRQHAHRKGGRWRPYDEEDSHITWNTSAQQPTAFPLLIPPGETRTMMGVDQIFGQRTNTAWRFRLAVDDKPRFNVWRSAHDGAGRRRRLWPAKWHRSTST